MKTKKLKVKKTPQLTPFESVKLQLEFSKKENEKLNEKLLRVKDDSNDLKYSQDEQIKFMRELCLKLAKPNQVIVTNSRVDYSEAYEE